jgi:hypothetical protein
MAPPAAGDLAADFYQRDVVERCADTRGRYVRDLADVICSDRGVSAHIVVSSAYSDRSN